MESGFGFVKDFNASKAKNKYHHSLQSSSKTELFFSFFKLWLNVYHLGFGFLFEIQSCCFQGLNSGLHVPDDVYLHEAKEKVFVNLFSNI